MAASDGSSSSSSPRNAVLLTAKRSPLGGLFAAAFVLTLVGLWLWLLLGFADDNVAQAFSLDTVAPQEQLNALPWARPASSQLSPPIPSGVNLQLRLYGQAALGCDAPLPLNFSGVPSIAGVQWVPSLPWAVQSVYSPVDWVVSSAFCGGNPNVSLLLFSCTNCTLFPLSSLTFALPFTCQSFF